MSKFLFRSASAYLTILTLSCVIAALFFIDKGNVQNIGGILLPPSSNHWFGTDSLGRDLFIRVLSGGCVSLAVGVICSLTTFAIGFLYGSAAGWFEGLTDKAMMRFCDILMAIPSFILVAVVCLGFEMGNIFGGSPQWQALIGLSLGISLTHWMSLARVTRGMVLEMKRKSFVEAATALGGTRWHIVRHHILPNILSTLLVLVALQIPTNILYESFMSFIGLGVHPPLASWGILVREGWKTLSSFPHLILFPSFILFLTVWSFHIVIDRLRSRP